MLTPVMHLSMLNVSPSRGHRYVLKEIPTIIVTSNYAFRPVISVAIACGYNIVELVLN